MAFSSVHKQLRHSIGRNLLILVILFCQNSDQKPAPEPEIATVIVDSDLTEVSPILPSAIITRHNRRYKPSADDSESGNGLFFLYKNADLSALREIQWPQPSNTPTKASSRNTRELSKRSPSNVMKDVIYYTQEGERLKLIRKMRRICSRIRRSQILQPNSPETLIAVLCSKSKL